MRCLYIVFDGLLTPNSRGGGYVIYYEQLFALIELGVEIVLWHQATPAERIHFEEWTRNEPDVWEGVQTRCASVELSTISPAFSLPQRMSYHLRKLFWPEEHVPAPNLRHEYLRVVERARPDFVWAQHLEPAALAISQQVVPVIYSHHDWLYRIQALRSGKMENPRNRATELGVVRRATAVVSGSVTECRELEAAGCKCVNYIPISYVPVNVDWRLFDATRPRLVHLGGMGTTASREGLRRFFEVVWPQLKEERVDLEVIGDISRAPEPLKRLLAEVKCRGFVANLAGLLRPGDIHIIAWEQNTGQRTRLPLAFNHGQVVVATRASVACFPEARDGENCRLVSQLADMAGVILELRRDREQRIKLAQNARRTFEQSFTRSALLPRYAEVLAAVQS